MSVTGLMSQGFPYTRRRVQKSVRTQAPSLKKLFLLDLGMSRAIIFQANLVLNFLGVAWKRFENMFSPNPGRLLRIFEPAQSPGPKINVGFTKQNACFFSHPKSGASKRPQKRAPRFKTAAARLEKVQKLVFGVGQSSFFKKSSCFT